MNAQTPTAAVRDETELAAVRATLMPTLGMVGTASFLADTAAEMIRQQRTRITDLIALVDRMETPSTPTVRLTVTCGECFKSIGVYVGEIAEKYPFLCDTCGRLDGKHPWSISTEIIPGSVS